MAKPKTSFRGVPRTRPTDSVARVNRIEDTLEWLEKSSLPLSVHDRVAVIADAGTTGLSSVSRHAITSLPIQNAEDDVPL
jgi:acyl-CoA synthetase (NDP forming)